MMSANYFVDSLINTEPQEVLSASAHFTDVCSSPFLSADCSHLSCSFASKNAVFTSLWDPLYSQKPVFYAKHPGIEADSRFLQPWIEPAVSRNYELKTDDFSGRKQKENSGYFYKPSTPSKTHINSSALISGKTEEDKPELDPSKLLTLHLLHDTTNQSHEKCIHLLQNINKSDVFKANFVIYGWKLDKFKM